MLLSGCCCFSILRSRATAEDVYVSGTYAYLANGGDGLRIYNITDPTNPLSIGHIDDSAYAYGVYVSGAYAYLANSDDGLRIYPRKGDDLKI